MDQSPVHDHHLQNGNQMENNQLADEIQNLTATKQKEQILQNGIHAIVPTDLLTGDNISVVTNSPVEQTEIRTAKDKNHDSDTVQVQRQVIQRTETVKTEVIITKMEYQTEECLTVQERHKLADQNGTDISPTKLAIVDEINSKNSLFSNTLTNVEKKSVQTTEEDVKITTTPSQIVPENTSMDLSNLDEKQPIADGVSTTTQENDQYQINSSILSRQEESVHQSQEVTKVISTTREVSSLSENKSKPSEDEDVVNAVTGLNSYSPRFRKLVDELVELPPKQQPASTESDSNSSKTSKKSMRDIVLERKELIRHTRAIKSLSKSPDGEGKSKNLIQGWVPSDPAEEKEKNVIKPEDIMISSYDDAQSRQTFQQLIREIAPKTKMALGLNKDLNNIRTLLLRGGKRGYGLVLGENEDHIVYISYITSRSLAEQSPLKVGDIIYSINDTIIQRKEQGEKILKNFKKSLICIAVRTDERIQINRGSTDDNQPENTTPLQAVVIKTETSPIKKKSYYNELFNRNKYVEPLVVSTSGGIANRAIIQGWDEFIKLARTAKLKRYQEEGWQLDNDENVLLNQTDNEDKQSDPQEEISQVKVSDDVRSLLTSASWQQNRKDKLMNSDKKDTVDGLTDVVETNVEVNVTMMTAMKIFKIILVGDSGVGKSSFINRFCHHNFDQFQRVTIDPGLHNKPVIIDDKVVMLEIWDTVGQERFDSLPRSYFRRADGIIALFDITSKDSFENIPTWLSHIEDWVENPPLLIMVGNKLDISDQRKVSIEDGFQMAFDHNAMYAETSARTGEHVFETCHQLARHLLEARNEEDTISSNNINDSIKVDSLKPRRFRRSNSRCC